MLSSKLIQNISYPKQVHMHIRSCHSNNQRPLRTQVQDTVLMLQFSKIKTRVIYIMLPRQDVEIGTFLFGADIALMLKADAVIGIIVK